MPSTDVASADPSSAHHAPAVTVNADAMPHPANPHSWLPLIGDPPGTGHPRILYGVLRPEYRGWSNSAATFAKAKIAIDTKSGEGAWPVRAARVEVLLPRGADDRFADPRTLMETIDAERPATRQVLLTYVTIAFETDRLHHQYELVRDFAMEELVGTLGIGVLLVQHAPHRAANGNLPHLHLLLTRRITGLGLDTYVPSLCGDKGRALIVDGFLPRYARDRG